MVLSLLEFLLLIHVGGAIIGFGPTLSFAVLGPLGSRLGGPGAVAIMEGMVAIEKKLVYPVAFVTQPGTGAWLIFEAGYADDFFTHDWLFGSILLYAFSFYLAVFVQTPSLDSMIELAKAGEAESERFQSLARKSGRIGPILTLSLVAIIILMVLKPGS